MKLKNNKGFTGIDISVAIVVFIIFSSIVITLFYNTTITSKKIERKAIATNLCINIVETLKECEFDSLTTTGDTPTLISLETLRTISGETLEIPNGYEAQITIENYKGENIIKILEVIINYKENNKTEEVKIETLIKNI